MKKLLIIGLLILSICSTISAQVMFHSNEFEVGIKNHLGLNGSENVTASILDTITRLDLSGLGISDLRDIRYLPNLQYIDLSYNKIEDVKSLVLLESLREVNLRNNELKSISALAFSYSKEMEVDVSFNHITDFSIFSTLTPCQFTIYGVGLQTIKDAPYFLVRYLYSDGTETKPSVYCRVDATTTEQAQMIVQDMSQSVATDDQPHVYELGSGIKGTQQVKVTDGFNTDSTYLVPLKIVQVQPSESVTIETELPENYDLYFSPAQNGTLSNDTGTLTFNASSTFEYEEIFYTFYRGGELKGLSKIILTKNDVTNVINTTIDNEKMKISLTSDILSVRCSPNLLSEKSVIEVYDIAGRAIVSQRIDSSLGIDEQIHIPRIPKDIIIVRVKSGHKCYVEKCTVK